MFVAVVSVGVVSVGVVSVALVSVLSVAVVLDFVLSVLRETLVFGK